MSHVFQKGTLLVSKETKTAYLVEETFTMTRLCEFRQLRSVGNLQMKTIRIDLATLSEQYDVVVPEAV